MYYIYYELEDGGTEFKEFETQDEAISHLIFRGRYIKVYHIIYGKEYKFVLVEGDFLKCKECGNPLCDQNYSGYCKHCYSEARKKEFKKECSECGNKIAAWNKSGLCKRCTDKKTSKERVKAYREKKKKPTNGRKHRKHRVHRESRHSEEVVEEVVEEPKDPKKGKCCRCKKTFTLEDWQHSTLHWCSDCRKHPDYKNFKE